MIKITNIETGESYTVNRPEEARDATDRSTAQTADDWGKPVSMGKIVAERMPDAAPEPGSKLTPVAALAVLINAVQVCQLAGTREHVEQSQRELRDVMATARAAVAAELARETATADQHERQRDALAELARAAEMYATPSRPRLGKLCKEARAALAEWEPNWNTRIGQPWRVVVEVRGGAVQDVTAPKGATVEVRDYDGGVEWESPNVCIWNGREEAAR